MFIDFWDILKTLLFKSKVLYYYFGQLKKKIGLLFNKLSGHTGLNGPVTELVQI